MDTRRYGPLRGPSSSSCGGLRPLAEVFLLFGEKKYFLCVFLAHFEVEVEVFDLDDVFPDKKPPSAASLPASHQLIGIFHAGFVWHHCCDSRLPTRVKNTLGDWLDMAISWIIIWCIRRNFVLLMAVRGSSHMMSAKNGEVKTPPRPLVSQRS